MPKVSHSLIAKIDFKASHYICLTTKKAIYSTRKAVSGNTPKMAKLQECENCTVYSYIYSLLLTMLLVMTLAFQNLIKLNQLHPKLT